MDEKKLQQMKAELKERLTPEEYSTLIGILRRIIERVEGES